MCVQSCAVPKHNEAMYISLVNQSWTHGQHMHGKQKIAVVALVNLYRDQDQPSQDQDQHSPRATNLWGFRSPGCPNEPALGSLHTQAYPLLGKYEYKDECNVGNKNEHTQEYNSEYKYKTK